MKQLIVTVHGIRTFGQWQESLQTLVLEKIPDCSFENYHYGYFSFLSFLIPPLRWLVVRRFRVRLLQLLEAYPDLRINLVGHSNGTYLIAWALYKLPERYRGRIGNVILAGSVLRADFPWNQLIENGYVESVINDCGVEDNVLLLSQFFVLFTGMAGRVGFAGTTGSRLFNRYFHGGHSLYFTAMGVPTDAFMKQYWLPILANNVLPTHIDQRKELTTLGGAKLWLLNNSDLLKISILFIVMGTFYYYVYALPRQIANEEFQQRRLTTALDFISGDSIPEQGITTLASIISEHPNRNKNIKNILTYNLQRFFHIDEIMKKDGFYRMQSDIGDKLIVKKGSYKAELRNYSPESQVWHFDNQSKIVILDGTKLSVLDSERLADTLLVVNLASEDWLEYDPYRPTVSPKRLKQSEFAFSYIWDIGVKDQFALISGSGGSGADLAIVDVGRRKIKTFILPGSPVISADCKSLLIADISLATLAYGLPKLPPDDGAYERQQSNLLMDDFPELKDAQLRIIEPYLVDDGSIKSRLEKIEDVKKIKWGPTKGTWWPSSDNGWRKAFGDCYNSEVGGRSKFKDEKTFFNFPTRKPDRLLWKLVDKTNEDARNMQNVLEFSSMSDIWRNRIQKLETNDAKILLDEDEVSPTYQIKNSDTKALFAKRIDLRNFGLGSWGFCLARHILNIELKCSAVTTEDYNEPLVISDDGRFALLRGHSVFSSSFHLIDLDLLLDIEVNDRPSGHAVARAFKANSHEYAILTDEGEIWVADANKPNKPILQKYMRPSIFKEPEHVFVGGPSYSALTFYEDLILLQLSPDSVTAFDPKIDRYVWWSRNLGIVDPGKPSNSKVKFVSDVKHEIVFVHNENNGRIISKNDGTFLSEVVRANEIFSMHAAVIDKEADMEGVKEDKTEEKTVGEEDRVWISSAYFDSNSQLVIEIEGDEVEGKIFKRKSPLPWSTFSETLEKIHRFTGRSLEDESVYAHPL